MFEELKGMKEVVQQKEEDLNTQQAIVKHIQDVHHRNLNFLMAKEKKLWRKLQVAQGKI